MQQDSNPISPPRGDMPNVLFIMTDQHRHDFMTAVGNSLVPTPNIDRIAARGIRFENAYCPYPVCLASRSSLLTGLYPHTTGAITNNDRLDWRYRTVANHFADHGYLTGLIGKMHFNDAHNHGFEYYLSINDWLMFLGPDVQLYADEIASHPLSLDHFFNTMQDSGAGLPDVDLWGDSSPWIDRVNPLGFDSMASRMEPDRHLDAFLARETVRFLERYQEQPFFLVTSFMKPHTPFRPPAEWAELYPVESISLPETGEIERYPEHIQHRIRNMQKIPEDLRRAAMAGYLGNLAFVDHCIGTVLDAFEELGLAENTILVYTSDHGEMHGDHGLFQKFCLFDPAAKVPLIVSCPGQTERNVTSPALVEYMGLYPTLSELAGLREPEGTALAGLEHAPAKPHAESFAELVQDPDAPGPEAVFSEYALRRDNAQFMVRTPQWKYIHNTAGSCHELYDLENDPGESVNRIDDPAVRRISRDLKDRLFQWGDRYDCRELI